MRKSIFFCLGLVLLISCNQVKGKKNNSESERITMPQELRMIRGKVVDSKRKKVAFAAIKLYLDDDDCMNGYTDNDGSFEFEVDELRIKDQSHFEVVYKGFAVNMLSLRNFEEKKPIVLGKKGELVTAADYHVFYESIKSCSRK